MIYWTKQDNIHDLSLMFGCLWTTYILIVVSPQMTMENSLCVIKIYNHSLCAIEWHTRNENNFWWHIGNFRTWVLQESIKWCTPTSHDSTRVSLYDLPWEQEQNPLTIAWSSHQQSPITAHWSPINSMNTYSKFDRAIYCVMIGKIKSLFIHLHSISSFFSFFEIWALDQLLATSHHL